MIFPRAIMGQVRCMARPRRPEAEIQAVREAARIVRRETGLSSAKALSREIARRVVVELVRELEADPLDLSLAAIERTLLGSPFQRLASCPDIDTVSEFVERRVKRFRARCGVDLPPPEQARERNEVAAELRGSLTHRYDRLLRANDG